MSSSTCSLMFTEKKGKKGGEANKEEEDQEDEGEEGQKRVGSKQRRRKRVSM